MSNEVIADIAIQLTILERCVAEVVCDPSVESLNMNCVVSKLKQFQENGICELLEPCHSCLSADANVKLECLIHDSNILNQVQRNVIVSKYIVQRGDQTFFKENMISCILNDLSECYVDKNISLQDALITLHTSPDEDVEVEFEQVETVNSSDVGEMGIGNVFILLQDIVLSIS